MSAVAPIKRTRRAKGEQTRTLILESTLKLIAEQGYRAVTHRAVAKQAGINHSLTTYYFKDLQELIAASFQYFVEKSETEIDTTWQEVFDYLAQFSSQQLKKKSVRETISEHLAEVSTDYILRQIDKKSEGLIVEMTFLFDPHIDPEMGDLARQAHNKRLEGFAELCRQLGSLNPELAAKLGLGTLQRLEFEGLASPQTVNRKEIHLQMKQQFDWLLGL